MINLHRFVFNDFYENTYIIWDRDSKSAAIIDPGCYNNNEQTAVVNFINSNKLSLKYLINTHCHIDHIFGNKFIKDNYDVTFLAPEKDLFMLDLMQDQAKKYGVLLEESPLPDQMINENEPIHFGDSVGRFIYTPGHSPGEMCLYFEKDKICFTGDVLFRESIGRSDLWGGNSQILLESIKLKLFLLPDDVEIYPGHEESSTIGHEKKHNPFLN